MGDCYNFREELAVKYPTLGHALWEPDSGGLYRSVEVGDVGLIRRGRFHRLFNALLPRDHQSDLGTYDGPNYPQQLQPKRPNHINRSRDYQKDFRSRSVIKEVYGPNVFAAGPDDGAPVTFSCLGTKGALISLPIPAQCEDTIAHGDFSKWIINNIDDCMRVAEDLGLGVNRMEDIILVTGRHLAKSWVNVSFSESRGGARVSFGVRVSGISGVHLEERNVTGGELKLGPSGERLPENQCIFLRGYRVVRILNIWPRLRGLAGPAPDIDEPEPEPEPEGLKLISIPADADYQDPLHVLLEYIAENAEHDCDLALVHDDDLEFIKNRSPEILREPGRLKSILDMNAPKIHQVHCRLSPGGNSGSGAEVAMAKVATLSENVLHGLHEDRSTSSSNSTFKATSKQYSHPLSNRLGKRRGRGVSHSIPVGDLLSFFPVSGPQNIATLDTDFQEAFPLLAPSPVTSSNLAASPWGTPARPLLAAHVSQETESFTLSAIDLSSTGKDGKPTTLGGVMKQVMENHKIKIEASTNKKTSQTTFHLKADSRKELDQGKRSLLASLSPVVSVIVDAPSSTIASIIGSEGATLKQISDQTSVKIDIPRRETLAVPGGDGIANAGSPHAFGATSPVPTDDDDDEPTVPITITGPQSLASEAQDLIKKIIASKRARTTRRVRDIPSHIVPFVKARYSAFVEAAEGGDVQLSLKSVEREVTVSGDREAVLRVVEAVRSTIAAVSSSVTSVKIPLPMHQHRLLVGNAVGEILASSKCVVTIPPTEDASEEVIVWGKAEDLGNGVAAVMSRVNSQYIHEFPLPGPIGLSRQLLRYIQCTSYARTLASAHPGVSVFIPELATRSKASVLNVDLVGGKTLVDAAVCQVSELMGKLTGSTKEVSVDWLVHKVVQEKHAKKIRQFHESHNVLFFFPSESEEQSSVLLVYDPTSLSASPYPVEKAKNIEEVEKELIKWAKDAGDIRSHVIAVEKKWHSAVIDKGGTTLRAIIGEGKALNVKVGAEASDPSTEDVILVRGASAEVEAAVRDILKAVEDVKNDLILSTHSVEFEINREYVGRVVGSQGSHLNKLRESLGVKIDLSDEGDNFKDTGKKRKGTAQKSKITIVGHKANIEEARRRIVSQVERLADETSEILNIPPQYHPRLIGRGGKYVLRLEKKYGVKITFPRGFGENAEGRPREHLQPDEVLIKGGKKGVAGAKSELLEAADFEKQSNNVVQFTVPGRAVSRILGKGGATITQIKDDTDVAIDLDNAEDGSGIIITCRGDKKAIAAAKAAILSIVDQVGEEVTEVLSIENKFHKTLIGAGGQNLRNLIARCGGPTDPKALARLVRFPRPGEEPKDKVRLRGEPALINRLKAGLEKATADLRDRVVFGVQIPAAVHSSLIGRGGRNIISFQNKYGVRVQYPGSNSYKHIGEPENARELGDVPPEELVKVAGARASVTEAIEELKLWVTNPTRPASVTDTFTVPLKYHDAVTSQGTIFRILRNLGVEAEPSTQPKKPSLPSHPPSSMMPAARAARVVDVKDTVTKAQWQIVKNYVDAEEGESTWNLKARDQESIDKAKAALTDAVDKAKAATHVGFLTLPDRSSFPRIVGTKGSNIVRLHEMTGANILVGRKDSTIIITGPESSLGDAKKEILKTVSSLIHQKRVY